MHRSDAGLGRRAAGPAHRALGYTAGCRGARGFATMAAGRGIAAGGHPAHSDTENPIHS